MNESLIFATALKKKTATERAAYLDEACGHNMELRSRSRNFFISKRVTRAFWNNPLLALKPPLKCPRVTGLLRIS